jgi:hypothetical protein
MSVDFLRTIAARLEAGEALDGGAEAMMIAAMHGANVRKFYIATGDAGGDELQIELSSGRALWFDPWPSRDTDTAIALVRECFPDPFIGLRGPGKDGQWWVEFSANNDCVFMTTAPEPAAAIMAAACRARADEMGKKA